MKERLRTVLCMRVLNCGMKNFRRLLSSPLAEKLKGVIEDDRGFAFDDDALSDPASDRESDGGSDDSGGGRVPGRSAPSGG